MPRYKKGTLVRIVPDDGENWETNSTEQEVEEGGWLWIVQRFVPIEHEDNEYDFSVYECKSITTGVIRQLFPEEITTKKEKSNEGN